MLFPSNFRPGSMPPRIPTGLPANFKGIPENREDLAKYIQDQAGGVPIDPLPVGKNTLRLGALPKKILAGLRGFLGFSAYEAPERPNKFTLRGCINFTGDYPPELVAARKKVGR